MIQIPAAEVEFNETGNTIWVHSPKGATILRIKTMGKIKFSPIGACENIVSHADIITNDDIHMCLADDAKEVQEDSLVGWTVVKIDEDGTAIMQDPSGRRRRYEKLFVVNKE